MRPQQATTRQPTICFMHAGLKAAAHHQALEDLLHGGGHSHLLIHPQVGRQAALHVAAQGRAEQVPSQQVNRLTTHRLNAADVQQDVRAECTIQLLA